MPGVEAELGKAVVLGPQADPSYCQPVPANIAEIEARTVFGRTDLHFAGRE